MPRDISENFTIGQLAKAAGVNIQTLRFYERAGILKPQSRRESGYRVYNEESLKRLHFIRQAKNLGFSLKEIQNLLNLRIKSTERCTQVRIKAEHKLKTVQEKIMYLRNLEKTLRSLILNCKKRVVSDCCPIIDKMEHPLETKNA